MSFFSIWITTAILMNYYREKLINALCILGYIIYPTYLFYNNLLLPVYLRWYTRFISAKSIPFTVSIIIGAFLAFSKPIGGLLFGVVFWNISRIIGYERNIKTYMIISGWGILLIFSSNQADNTNNFSISSFWTSHNYDFSHSIIFDVIRNL